MSQIRRPDTRKGLGALAGGFVYEYLGPQLMFRVAALVSILSSLVYFFAVFLIRRRGTDYKQFIDTRDDVEEPSGSVQLDTHRRHENEEDPSTITNQPPLTIQGRKRSMHLPLTDIYQPENPLCLSIDQDQECLLSSEATPPELKVTRLEFQPPPDWLKGRSYGGADTTENKRELEVRLDAIGSETEARGGRRRGTLTSLV